MQSSSDPKNSQKSKPPIPETVGATSAPFQLTKGITTISFEIHAPKGPALLRPDGQPKRVLLRLENIRSTTVAPSFGVYFNVPPGEDPQRFPSLFAFKMSTFGLVEASDTSAHHPGDGLSSIQDVTQLFLGLAADKNWDGKTLRISFVPSPWKDPVNVEVGRASLVLE